MAYVDFKALKAVTLEQAVSFLTELRLSKKEGDQLRFPCPACGGDNKRALSVNIGGKGFRCFSSNKSGNDAVSLVAHVRKIGQREAGEQLQEHFLAGSVTSPARGNTATSTKAERSPELSTDHPVIEALQLSEIVCRSIGIGVLDERLCIPLRLPDGTLLGHLGIATTEEMAPLLQFPADLEDKVAPKKTGDDVRKFLRLAVNNG